MGEPFIDTKLTANSAVRVEGGEVACDKATRQRVGPASACPPPWHSMPSIVSTLLPDTCP